MRDGRPGGMAWVWLVIGMLSADALGQVPKDIGVFPRDHRPGGARIALCAGINQYEHRGALRPLAYGVWNDGPRTCRASNRHDFDPSSRYEVVGFRVARVL